MQITSRQRVHTSSNRVQLRSHARGSSPQGKAGALEEHIKQVLRLMCRRWDLQAVEYGNVGLPADSGS